jgi:hypothetical protein
MQNTEHAEGVCTGVNSLMLMAKPSTTDHPILTNNPSLVEFMLRASQYNFPHQYSNYHFFMVIESYNQQLTMHCCGQVILLPCKMNYVKLQILYNIFLYAKYRILQAPKFYWKF